MWDGKGQMGTGQDVNVPSDRGANIRCTKPAALGSVVSPQIHAFSGPQMEPCLETVSLQMG